MRKRTGLRNKHRSGKSAYSRGRKGLRSDRYGKVTGREITDIIAGNRITYTVGNHAPGT